jgi:hypothetical protein
MIRSLLRSRTLPFFSTTRSQHSLSQGEQKAPTPFEVLNEDLRDLRQKQISATDQEYDRYQKQIDSQLALMEKLNAPAAPGSHSFRLVTVLFSHLSS